MDAERYRIDENGVLTVTNGVASIYEREFKDFDKITKVYLPRTVRHIGYGAFHGCKRMKAINIPSHVKSIESWAFARCESLTQIDIPDGVISIDTNAFYGCTKLKKVHLPSTLQEIKEDAFYNCKSLKEIVVPSSTRMVYNFGSPFSGCDALEKVIIRDVKPCTSNTETKKLVLLGDSLHYKSCRLYGVIISAEADEDITEYARQQIKELLWASFTQTARYLDLTDWSGDTFDVAEELGYDKQRFAIADMPEGAAPATVQISESTCLADETLYNSIISRNEIKWIQL